MTSMQLTEVYSDSSCKSVISLTIISTGTCSTSKCMLAIIAGSTYYTATSCLSEEIYEHTNNVYEDTDYLLVDLYSGTDCNTYIGSTAFTASGVCEVADAAGNSVIATLFSNGSAELTYYLDGSCIIPSISLLITTDDVSNHTCLDNRKYYLRSEDAATNGDSNDGGFRLSGGVIRDIIGGVLLVLVLVVVLVYRIRQRQRRLNKQHYIQRFSLANGYGNAYDMQFSPTKSRSYATTTISDFNQHGLQIRDDDVIIAARIPRAEVKVGKLINRGGYGEVYMGSYHGKQVAVKILLPEKKKTMSQVNAFLSEIELMARLDHPRIVSFIGVAWNQLIDICAVLRFVKEQYDLVFFSKQRKLPNAAILQMVAAGELCVRFSKACPQSMVKLGLACVSLDPKDRPTATEAQYRLTQILAKEV
ncbi:unnamed protein product [Peronospora destructor]|uniref:Protein kinase domain-containing protein n=1 Tax=Peronospora destructor TaxID=86335 RepID=A0AAV0VDY3_9STRA|nr:unnamed protein product [Peronospora destructor]